MITVATWNIQKGIGTDFRRRIERTADVAASVNADVIGLQEVVRTTTCDQADILARRLGCELAWGPARALRKGTGTYGNALLVRGRVLETRVHDLSVPRWEPRACLEALVESGGLRVRVFVCHLGLGMRERTLQVARVMDAVRDAAGAEPRVVVGDFNEWNHGAVARAFDVEFPHVPRPGRTHPSPLPVFSLDRIAWDLPLHGDLDVLPVRGASDHRMVRAILS